MFGIGDVLGTLKSLSSSFLLSYFFPAFLFEVGSLGLYYFDLDAVPVGLPRPTADQFVWPIIDLSFGAVVIACLLSVSTGLMRQFLEGQFLPPRLAQYLVTGYQRLLQRMLDDEDAALQFRADVQLGADAGNAQLQAARAVGEAVQAVPHSDLIRAAETAVAKSGELSLADVTARLNAAWTLARRAELQKWKSVTQAVAAALAANCADDTQVADEPSKADALALDRVHMAWSRKLNDGVERATRYANLYYSKRTAAFAKADVRPTRFGNLRAIMEAEPRNVYGSDFSYIWPRVQAQLDPAAGSSASLGQATTQLELALALMILTVLAIASWPPILLWFGAWWTFIIFTTLAPIAASAAYQLALESQRLLSGNVWAVIDRDRIKVLEAMHIAYPATSAEERQRWELLLLNAANAKRVIPLSAQATA